MNKPFHVLHTSHYTTSAYLSKRFTTDHTQYTVTDIKRTDAQK